MALLASIHPALMLLTVCAVPTLFDVDVAARIERYAQEARRTKQSAGASSVQLATTAPSGKEVRVTGIGGAPDHRPPMGVGSAGMDRWQRLGGARRCGIRCVGGFSDWRTWARWCSCRPGLRAPASAVLLVLAAGARLSAYIGATVGEIGFLRGFWMDGSRRLAWLEDYAASVAALGDMAVCPPRYTAASGSEHVSFAYPGTSRVVLDDVSLTLPVGAGR